VGGLDDHRNIAAGVAHPRQHAHAVEIRHHQVEDHAIDARRLGAAQHLDRGIAALGGDGLIAETLHHVFDEATLDRIVVDDQHHLRHETGTPTRRCADLEQCRLCCLTGA
jgi:hypothetical protein